MCSTIQAIHEEPTNGKSGFGNMYKTKATLHCVQLNATSGLDYFHNKMQGQENYGNFVSLLLRACNGQDKTMGLPSEKEFWTKFAANFGQMLHLKWTPDKCESYCKEIRDFYIRADRLKLFAQPLSIAKQPMVQFVGQYKNILEQVFGQYREYFSSFKLSQTDDYEESVPATQPLSNSSAKRASRSHGSVLAAEEELLVQQEIAELEKRGMLNMIHIAFAEPYLSRSTWATCIFLNQDTWEKKRDFILKAMKEEEEEDRREKRRKKWDGLPSNF